jgi:hypothetical protein
MRSPVGTVPSVALQGEKAVGKPYELEHWESKHSPVEQTWHEGPQPLALFVVLTHVLPHNVNPPLHETEHVLVVVHTSVTPVVVMHVAHAPAQQIPPVHGVVLLTGVGEQTG